MPNFITNLCPNPSFEVSLSGYTALAGTTISQSSLNSWAGLQSMLVQTTGTASGQGFTTPMGAAFSGSTTGSASLYLSGGSGSVTVQVVVNPGGTVLASQVVTLTTSWQRVTLSGVAFSSGQQVYIVVQTPTPQALSFFVDAVQYEPESPAQQYIDGDVQGCQWSGIPGLSASFKPYAFTVSAAGGLFLEGHAQIIQQGEIFQVKPPAGTLTLSGTAASVVTDPIGALDDFAMFELTDLDPAMTYTGQNTANLNSGVTGYNRNWAVFYPPIDYPVSDGSYLWSRAAYAAVGFEFADVAPNSAQNVTQVQVEQMPISSTDSQDSSVSPSTYDTPRALHTIVKPARLNYCPNPSFETSLSGWGNNGGATSARDTTLSSPDAGTASMQVTLASVTDSVSITISDLITGNIYIASLRAYVKTSTFANIQLSIGQSSGGIPGATTASLAVDVWLQPYVVFTATSPTATLTVFGTPASGESLPDSFWIDAVLIEEGEILQPYFDGGSGSPDYMWETGGTANLSRSYYYPQYNVNVATIHNIINNSIPVGLTPAVPLWAVPPSQ